MNGSMMFGNELKKGCDNKMSGECGQEKDGEEKSECNKIFKREFHCFH